MSGRYTLIGKHTHTRAHTHTHTHTRARAHTHTHTHTHRHTRKHTRTRIHCTVRSFVTCNHVKECPIAVKPEQKQIIQKRDHRKFRGIGPLPEKCPPYFLSCEEAYPSTHQVIQKGIVATDRWPVSQPNHFCNMLLWT